MNWIDTAAVYGIGHSEEVVGRALREMPAGDRPYVFTKCSLAWDAEGTVFHSLQAASIRKEVEGSLRRLQTDRIDLYQIHWPVWPSSPPGHQAPGSVEEAWETMVALRQEGKVSWIGVSNFDVANLRRIQKIEPPTSLQPPYSLLRPEIEQELLPFCLEHNIGVIPYSPMQSGLLTGKMTRERIAAFPAGDFRRNSRFSGAHADKGTDAGGPAAGHRQAARPLARRSGHRLGAGASGDHGGDCGRTAAGSSG